MKTRLRVTPVIALYSVFATTAGFGQTTYVWTNQSPLLLSGGDLNQATNWSPNGVPRPDSTDGATYGDEMRFDGRTTGHLAVTQNGGVQANGAGTGLPYGLRIHLTSNQASSVTIQSPVTVSGGMRMNYFLIDAGSGGLNLGDHSVNALDIIAGVTNGQILGFTNNSSTPCVINETVRWGFGGAGAHPFVFAGSGDWIVNNRLRSAAGQSAAIVQKVGPGTMTWTGTNAANAIASDLLGSPITIGRGTMIFKTSGIVGVNAGAPNIVQNGTLLKYDAPDGGTCLMQGTISGTGPIQMNAGTLLLSGQNTISGNWILSGGTLIVGSTENTGVSGPLGLGGTISFSGGTLTYSTNNAFDYSSRFSTAAGQAISIDTTGQIVTYATALASSGGTLTKAGNGQLTLTNTSSYSGLTTISGGTLTFQGPKTGSGDISVADGATLGVFDSGMQITPGTLTLGTNAGANLEFDNVASTSTAPLVPATIVSAGTNLISINSGTFDVGRSYPLLTWASGTAPAVSLGNVNNAGGTLSTNGNTIQFNVISVALVWTGATSGNWSDPGNWTTPYADSKPVLFDDTAPGTTNVEVDIPVYPAGVTVKNNAKTFSIASSGVNNIAGSTGLTKQGTGTLTLSGGANTYTGVTTLSGGILSVGVLANGGFASDIGAASSTSPNLVFNGGTLQFTGAATTSDRLFTVGLSGGKIDVAGTGSLTLNNPGTVTLAGTLTLSGGTADTNVLASALISSGGLSKSGTDTWVLTGTNSYGGGTVVVNGVLQVGTNGATGSLGGGNVSVGAGAAIDFRRMGTLTVPGAISGNGTVIQNGSGTVILANNNAYPGGTTINAGTLQVGNGGATGSLLSSGSIVNNSLLVFNTSGSFIYGSGGIGSMSGAGNVIVQGGGFIKAIGNNTYTGWTRIDPITTFQPREGQDGFLVSSAVTNNGVLRLVSQDAAFTYGGPIVGSGGVQIGANNVNVGVITLTGTNTYTGGTVIGGNTLVLGDGSTPVSGSITGNVQFVSNFTSSQDNPRIIAFNRPDDFTFGGTITTNFAAPQNNLGLVQHNGTGKLTLTGTNTYGSGTVINSGTLIVGNGGTSGSLGFGPVTDNSALIFNRSGSLTVPGAIRGVGSVTLIGSGTVTLSATNNPAFGPTTVSNGTLVVTSLGGDLNVEGGTVLVAGTRTAANLTVSGNLNIDSGTVVASLNRAASPTNTTYTVLGTLNHTGGTLKLLIAGPALQVGDKFTIFNQTVPGGATMPIISPGCTVSNSLASDGSVVVTSAQPLPSLTPTMSGNQLTLSWPAAWTGGVVLQAQTNRLTTGLSTNWVTLPGTDATNGYVTTIAKTNGTVFFRLTLP